MERFIRGTSGVLSFAAPIGLFSTALTQSMSGPGDQSTFGTLRLVFGVSGIFLMVAYAIYAAMSSAVPSSKRGLWIAVIFFGNILVLPIFWFWYVRHGTAAVGKNGDHHA